MLFIILGHSFQIGQHRKRTTKLYGKRDDFPILTITASHFPQSMVCLCLGLWDLLEHVLVIDVSLSEDNCSRQSFRDM